MSGDSDILKEIRDNRVFAETELSEQRKEARKDRLCVAGKVWEAMDPDALRERNQNKRPALNSDEINQYINQVVNDVRANPRGIKYAPTGNGANDAGAEFYQNHVREIEYRCKASIIYAHAFEEAVTSGIGWLRITSKREHPRTFNQDLWIEMVANADQVLPDPMAIWPDSRDAKFLVYLEPWARSAFEQKYPNARAVGMSAGDAMKIAKGWVTRDVVQVGEYWKVEAYTRRLLALKPDGGDPDDDSDLLFHFKDELEGGTVPPGYAMKREEDAEDTRVCSYLTNGIEILDGERKWPGRYIPFASCRGKVVYIDGKPVVLSMTRLARDPAMLHAYMITCEAEAVGGIPRSQWVGYEGQFAKPDSWKRAQRQPVAYLEAKVTVPGNPNPQQPLPLPQKQSWDPPLQNLEAAIEARKRSIQAAMGISPQPTDVQRRNDISGEAWKQRQSQGQLGSFHFVDSYDLMIQRTGEILENLIDKVIDAARDVPVRLAGDKADVVRVNDPKGSAYNGQQQLGGDPIFTKGDYRCTISTGPADASQREAADEFVDALVGNLANIAQLAGPQIALKILAQSVRLKQLGPLGDEIAELLDPPQLGQDGKPIPPQMAALLGQNKQLQQLLQQAQAEKQGKVLEQQGKMAVVQVQEQHEDQRAAMDRETKIAVAEIVAQAKQSLQDMALFYEERSRIGAQIHEQAMGGHDAAQADAQARRAMAHENAQGARELVSQHVADEMNHQRALELASHQASLQPDPQAAGDPTAAAAAGGGQ